MIKLYKKYLFFGDFVDAINHDVKIINMIIFSIFEKIMN